VESKSASKTSEAKTAGTKMNGGNRHDGEDKLNARASRFGVAQSEVSGQKRTRSPVPVDDAETEKRLKRAQRFGLKA